MKCEFCGELIPENGLGIHLLTDCNARPYEPSLLQQRVDELGKKIEELERRLAMLDSQRHSHDDLGQMVGESGIHLEPRGSHDTDPFKQQD